MMHGATMKFKKYNCGYQHTQQYVTIVYNDQVNNYVITPSTGNAAGQLSSTSPSYDRSIVSSIASSLHSPI